MTLTETSKAIRRLFGVVAVATFLAATFGAASAGTTGNINGTITAVNGTALAGVQVIAISPSAKYTATTDAKGFFAIAGVTPDTYSVILSASGYSPYTVSGVTVFQDQTVAVNQQLNTALRTIGRTAARNQASAFQPTVPENTINLGATQIQTQLGKKNNVSESNLLVSLPGASLDSSGYPVLRGGRENEEGFQFEGIDYTDAFTSQFVNSLALNNAGNFQLTPGAGDASSGNTGTGVINLLTKRGSYPAFGSLDAELLTRIVGKQLAGEYGFATPDGKVSNYTTYTFNDQDRIYGPYGADPASIGAFFSTQHQHGNDLINNFVYKFGKNNNQSLQALYQNQWFIFNGNYGGGVNQLPYKTNDPYALSRIRVYTGLTPAQFLPLLQPYLGQTSQTDLLQYVSGSTQPNETIKLQYSLNPGPSSFYTVKYYKVNSVAQFRRPFNSEDSLGNYYFSEQGGQRTGFAGDGNLQLGNKHLLKFGGKYELLTPVFGYASPVFGAEVLGPILGNGNEIKDFLPGGYLAKNGFFDQTVPVFWESTSTVRQDTSAYVTDSWSPTSRLKIDAGVRLDISNYRYPSPTRNPELFATNPDGSALTSIDSAQRNPHIIEPRFAFAYQFGRNDAIRGSYARTVEFPPLADVDAFVNRAYYNSLPYSNLPATQPVCGISGTGKCASYGEQLFWENQNFSGVPFQPIKPETFSNFDFSYSHQFPNNLSVKITPFYRRGYDALVQYATVRTVNGVPVTDPVTGAYQFNPSQSSNLGINRTTGVELYITKDNPGPGFSGSISATYLNEFSNVIPLSASEDFFPTIPAASALLGKVYRVGFLSPFQATAALAYQTKSGFRINPIVSYNIGYPISYGNSTAYLAGGKPLNVPNTNVTSGFGSSVAPNYVDPLNPGTLQRPNIAASRGTNEGNDPGSKLSAQRVTANLSIEFTPSRTQKGGTYGLFISNLFNQVYGQPSLNSRWQPVATGLAGPTTGKVSQTVLFPGVGFANYDYVQRFGNQPYIITPNGAPRLFRLYYQFAF